jgi:hypothetical protein
MALIDIVTLDDTWSDIHTTPAVLNPLVGRRLLGDSMAIITCVTTLQESLDHIVNYVWHILKLVFPPKVCPFRTVLRSIRRRRPHRIVESSAVQHGPSGKEKACTDDGRRPIPAGVNGRGCAASLRGPVAAARYATPFFTC